MKLVPSAQLRFRGNLLLGSIGSELPEGEIAGGRQMRDFGLSDGKLVGSDAQSLCRGRNKHFARRRGRMTHCAVEARDRRASRSQDQPLVEHGIDVVFAALGRELISHPRPGGAQFRGDDLSHAGGVSLSTLGLSNDRRDDVVLADRKKCVELPRARQRFLRAGASDRDLEREKESGRTNPLEERTPTR
jgi:hypothetical protein